jgi:hypothetical protein
MADPEGTRTWLPSGVPYDFVHVGLLATLIVIVVAIVVHMRRLGGPD